MCNNTVQILKILKTIKIHTKLNKHNEKSAIFL